MSAQHKLLMVTHDPRAASWADRAIFLSDGRVVDEARDPNPEEILERIRWRGSLRTNRA